MSSTRSSDPAKPSRWARLKQRVSAIAENYRLARSIRRTLSIELIGLFVLGVAIVAFPVGILFNWPTGILLGLPVGLLAGTFWFSRVAIKAAYKRIEGQPGAAAAVIQNMRGNWTVTPAVAVTKSQDLVSRVVGRCGVVLVGEGTPTRVVNLLATERKKTGRWLPEVPIYEIQVGTEEGQVSLQRLQRELTKLPRNLRPAEATEVRRRLEALSQRSAPVPIPKGPLPTRMPRA
jgi:hypothetical protein